MEEQDVDGSGSDYYNLKAAGIDVRWASNSALMHDKFMVVDGEFLVTGSFNWFAAAANSNNENLAVIRSAAWAQTFETTFQNVYVEAVAG